MDLTGCGAGAGALPPGFFARDVLLVARELVGAGLWIDGVGGRIVETEAYRPDDPASHSHAGPTPRTRTMFGPPGRIYIYRSYGLHWCMNLVAGDEPGSAVLLRALEPLDGLERMRARRAVVAPRLLASGPGRLCQALGVGRELDGASVFTPPVRMAVAPAGLPIVTGPRIGISKAVHQPWRFGLAGSPHLSRPFPRA